MKWSWLENSWVYYLSPGLVLLNIIITTLTGKSFFLLWLIYCAIPVMDVFIKEDNENPTPEQVRRMRKENKWKIPLGLFMALEWYSLYWGLKNQHFFSGTDWLLLLLNIGHTSAIGLLVAHEVFHKRDLLSQVLGALHLSKNLNMHFYSEHLEGHHANVATPLDPASARLNQTVYAFFLQSWYGQYVDTWKRETSKQTKSGKPGISLQNRMVQWTIFQLGLVGLSYKIAGVWGLIFFLAQCLIAQFLLEVINYVEHYGLQRKEIEPGVYEPVNIKHSWNAPQAIQNVVLLKLQRHSDHHAHALKPYQILESLPESPKLPGGYAVCVLLALVPSVWYSVINPLCESANKTGVVKEEDLVKSRQYLNLFIFAQASLATCALFLF